MNRRYIIPAVVGVVIIAALIALSVRKTHMLNNDAGVVGNTAGNLYGSGLFCEHDGKVYFANPSHSGALYVMNPDESEVKKISGSAVKYINVDDNRIYYSLSGASSGSGLGYIRKATGLYSCNHKGGSGISYTQDAIGAVVLAGNRIFYQHYIKTRGTFLDSIRIDKSDEREYLPSMVNPSCVYNGSIYYAGAPTAGDMYLHKLDIATGDDTVVYSHQMYQPIYQDGVIYYIDLETDYELHRYDLLSGEDITLTDEKVEMFNVGSGMIYYQTDSSSADAALKRMTTDGFDTETVMTGIYSDINITSNFVYFHGYDSIYPMYHQGIRSGVNVMPFEPE